MGAFRGVFQLILSVTSMVCFVFGTIANLFLLYRIIVSTLVSRATRRYGLTSVKELPHSSSTRAYITLISITDLLGLCIIPISLIQSKYGQMLSIFTCQFIYATDWSSKFLVAMLLTGLTIHRYMSICSSPKTFTKAKQFHFTKGFLILWSSVIIATTIPIFIATVRDTSVINSTGINSSAINKPKRCVIYFPNENWNFAIQLESVVLACVLPASLITVFSRLTHIFLRQRRQHKEKYLTPTRDRPSNTRSASKCRQLTVASNNLISIVFWYFVCFVPYWSLSIIASNFILPGDLTVGGTVLIIVCYIGNLGPYIHACVNPLLCLRMNKNLWYSNASNKSTASKQKISVYKGSGQNQHELEMTKRIMDTEAIQVMQPMIIVNHARDDNGRHIDICNKQITVVDVLVEPKMDPLSTQSGSGEFDSYMMVQFN